MPDLPPTGSRQRPVGDNVLAQTGEKVVGLGFHGQFQQISGIFDQLERALSSIQESDSWTPETVMVAEMLRLRMKRLMQKSDDLSPNKEVMGAGNRASGRRNTLGGGDGSPQRDQETTDAAVRQLQAQIQVKEQIIGEMSKKIGGILEKSSQDQKRFDELLEMEESHRKLKVSYMESCKAKQQAEDRLVRVNQKVETLQSTIDAQENELFHLRTKLDDWDSDVGSMEKEMKSRHTAAGLLICKTIPYTAGGTGMIEKLKIRNSQDYPSSSLETSSGIAPSPPPTAPPKGRHVRMSIQEVPPNARESVSFGGDGDRGSLVPMPPPPGANARESVSFGGDIADGRSSMRESVARRHSVGDSLRSSFAKNRAISSSMVDINTGRSMRVSQGDFGGVARRGSALMMAGRAHLDRGSTGRASGGTNFNRRSTVTALMDGGHLVDSGLGLDELCSSMLALNADMHDIHAVLDTCEALLRDLFNNFHDTDDEPFTPDSPQGLSHYSVKLYCFDDRVKKLWCREPDGANKVLELSETDAGEVIRTSSVVHSKVDPDDPATRMVYFPLHASGGSPCAACEVKTRYEKKSNSDHHIWPSHIFDPRSTFTFLLTHAGIVIERALQFQSLTQARDKHERLYNTIAPLFSLVGNLRMLLDALQETCSDLLHAQFVQIFCVDTHRDVLFTFQAKQEKTYPLRDSENVACHVAVTGTPINLHDCRSQKRFRIDFSEDVTAKTCLAMPITGKGSNHNVFGVILALNKQDDVAYFSVEDESVCTEFATVCFTAMEISTEKQRNEKQISSILDQRNNLLSSVHDVEKMRGNMDKLTHLLAEMSACVDPLTIIHRFVQGSKESLGVADIHFVSYNSDNNMLLTEGGGAMDATIGAMGKAVQTRKSVHINDPKTNQIIVRQMDFPKDVPQDIIQELLFVPLLLKNHKPAKEKQLKQWENTKLTDQGVSLDDASLMVSGIFRVVSTEKGKFDSHFIGMMNNLATFLLYACDRGSILEQAVTMSDFKDIYNAFGTRSLFRAVATSLRRATRCSRVYVMVADEQNEALWTLTGAQYDTKMEIPLSTKHIEGQVWHMGSVVNMANINKPCLDQVLGNMPTGILCVPIRADKRSKPLGVLVAVDKLGMLHFDQVDEISALSHANAAAIGLKHALSSLRKLHECRQYQFFAKSVIGLLKCHNVEEFVSAATVFGQQLSQCSNCDLFILNSSCDALVALAPPRAAEATPGAIPKRNDDERFSANGLLEVLPIGRYAYIDQALRGEVIWPDGIYLGEDRNPLPSEDGASMRVVLCVPVCLSTGRCIGIMRFLDSPSRTSFESVDSEMLRTYASIVAETMNWVRRTHLLSDVTAGKQTMQDRGAHGRLVLVTKADGRLIRFNGSTKAILGKSDSILRSTPCWEWLMESDVWRLATKYVFERSGGSFGKSPPRSPQAKTATTSADKTSDESEDLASPDNSIYIKDFHWLLKGRLMTANLMITSFRQPSLKKDTGMSHCYICLSGIRAVNCSMLMPVSKQLRVATSTETTARGNSKFQHLFLLGCHVQLVREDATDQQFALVSVVMKIMECICKFSGNIYTMDDLTICAVFLEHMDMMAAGCIIDQELGSPQIFFISTKIVLRDKCQINV